MFQTLEELSEYFSHDKIQCLICGEWFESLSTHIKKHGTTTRDYKIQFGLPIGKGLIGNVLKRDLYARRSHLRGGCSIPPRGKRKPLSEGEKKMPPFQKEILRKSIEKARSIRLQQYAHITHCPCGLLFKLSKKGERRCTPCSTKRSLVYVNSSIEIRKKVRTAKEKYRKNNMEKVAEAQRVRRAKRKLLTCP